jgi:hypothetical protein
MRRDAYRSRDSFAQVSWEMVGECDGEIALAAIFDWIAWKADEKYGGVRSSTGQVWYTASASALSKTMNTSEKVVRRALTRLVELGHLDAQQLRLGGYGDRTMSYRPVWSIDVSTGAGQEDPRNSAFAPQGESIRPTGQISSALQGESTITNHFLTEVKRLSLIDDEDAPAEPSIDELFDSFWTCWPRKVDKKDAVRAFAKALSSPMLRTLDKTSAAWTITNSATAWATQWREVEQRPLDKIPHAASWLNAERWTDEIPSPASQPAARTSNAQRALALAQDLERRQDDGRSSHREALDAGLSR